MIFSEYPTEEEIRAFLHDRRAHFKIPRYIRFVAEFSMTDTDKVREFSMREIALTRLQEVRQ